MKNAFDSFATVIFKNLHFNSPWMIKRILPHLLSPEPQKGICHLTAFGLGNI